MDAMTTRTTNAVDALARRSAVEVIGRHRRGALQALLYALLDRLASPQAEITPEFFRFPFP